MRAGGVLTCTLNNTHFTVHTYCHYNIFQSPGGEYLCQCRPEELYCGTAVYSNDKLNLRIVFWWWKAPRHDIGLVKSLHVYQLQASHNLLHWRVYFWSCVWSVYRFIVNRKIIFHRNTRQTNYFFIICFLCSAQKDSDESCSIVTLWD